MYHFRKKLIPNTFLFVLRIKLAVNGYLAPTTYYFFVNLSQTKNIVLTKNEKQSTMEASEKLI